MTTSKSSDNHFWAQAVHDVGSALWLGGAVMGIAGVNKSGADLSQGIDRIRVANSAWSRFGPVEWAGIAATAVTGTRLTASNKGRLAAQKGFARAGAAKAAATALGAAATGWATYTGGKVGKAAEAAHARGEAIDVKDASIPTEGTPAELAKWQRRQRAAQFLVPVFAGANVVLTSYLTQSYRPAATAKGILGRLLPS
ncbi:hypothetical protein [Quadrisphaera sp. DSM 44207]|uniref:hypothetical protein n=1 Tax=Quadrisphaera sp. DSM 44207 TaxID=1881057 RepID=UPI0008844F64|nr:hypothetical protein [Quadrisphaera sp. DSM 44207]SDQ11397.1 hypothetical protein SAMN05428996_0601 [Quadrisphaera sp. DSM 44207]